MGDNLERTSNLKIHSLTLCCVYGPGSEGSSPQGDNKKSIQEVLLFHALVEDKKGFDFMRVASTQEEALLQ